MILESNKNSESIENFYDDEISLLQIFNLLPLEMRHLIDAPA